MKNPHQLKMNRSNNIHLTVLDLPNEILLIIFHKLKMADVLYSLVNVNERFDRLVLDPLYIHHLDMSINSSFDHVSSIDNEILSRVCEKILPRIINQINKVTVQPHSINRILFTVNYPQVYALSLINFPEEMLFKYLAGILLILFITINNEAIKFKLLNFVL
jgi:hypothetical protein